MISLLYKYALPRSVCILIPLSVFSVFLFGGAGNVNAQENPSLSVVQIIDRSQSLEENDPKGKLTAAASFILDILPMYGSSSKGAILFFADGVMESSSSASLEDYDRLKARLERSPTATGQWSCYPDAFKKAIAILNSSKSEHKHIYLFTDAEGKCERFKTNISNTDVKRAVATEMMEQVIPELVKNGIRVYIVFLNEEQDIKEIEDLHQAVTGTRGGAFNAKNADEILEATKKIISINERVISIDQQVDAEEKSEKVFTFDAPTYFSILRVSVSDPRNRYSARDRFPVELITPNGENVAAKGTFIVTSPTKASAIRKKEANSRVEMWTYIGRSISGKWTLKLKKAKRNYKKMVLYVDGYSRMVPEINLNPDAREFRWKDDIQIQVELSDPGDGPDGGKTPKIVKGFVRLPSGEKDLLSFKGGEVEYKAPSESGRYAIEIQAFIDESQERGFPATKTFFVGRPDPIEIRFYPAQLDFGRFTPCAEKRRGEIKISYEGKDRGGLPLKVKWSSLPSFKGASLPANWFQFNGRPVEAGVESVRRAYGTIGKENKTFEMTLDYKGKIYTDLASGQYTGEIQIFSDEENLSSNTLKIVCEIQTPRLIIGASENISYDFWWNVNKDISLRKRISIKTDNPDLIEDCETGFSFTFQKNLFSRSRGHKTILNISDIDGLMEDADIEELFSEDESLIKSRDEIPLSPERISIYIDARPSDASGEDFDRSRTKPGRMIINAPLTGDSVEREITASYGLFSISGKRIYAMELFQALFISLGVYILGSCLLWGYPTLKKQSALSRGKKIFGETLEPGEIIQFKSGKNRQGGKGRVVLPSDLLPNSLFEIQYEPDRDNPEEIAITMPEMVRKYVNVVGDHTLSSGQQCEIELYRKGRNQEQPYFILEIDHVENGEVEVITRESPFKTKGYAAKFLFKRLLAMPLILSAIVFLVLPSPWLADIVYKISLGDMLSIFRGEFMPMFTSIAYLALVIATAWLGKKAWNKLFDRMPIRS